MVIVQKIEDFAEFGFQFLFQDLFGFLAEFHGEDVLGFLALGLEEFRGECIR